MASDFFLLEAFRSKPFVEELNLCRVLLENTKLPWIFLIPKRNSVFQINNLSESDQMQLMTEINLASNVMEKLFPCDRLNVATIGNKTPQLHVHIICRTTNDPFWPETVWGHSLLTMSTEEITERTHKLREAFARTVSKLSISK